MKKPAIKMSSIELQEFLQFKHRGSRVEAKRGKGSYKRHPKHKNIFEK